MQKNLRSVSDPLLGPIDDPFFPVLALNSLGLQAHNVTSCLSFRHGQADELLARENIWKDLGLQLVRTEVEHRGQANDLASEDT